MQIQQLLTQILTQCKNVIVVFKNAEYFEKSQKFQFCFQECFQLNIQVKIHKMGVVFNVAFRENFLAEYFEKPLVEQVTKDQQYPYVGQEQCCHAAIGKLPQSGNTPKLNLIHCNAKHSNVKFVFSILGLNSNAFLRHKIATQELKTHKLGLVFIVNVLQSNFRCWKFGTNQDLYGENVLD